MWSAIVKGAARIFSHLSGESKNSSSRSRKNHCQVIVPDKGNYEINIKKLNDNQNIQNGNRNRQNGNQNGQRGNHNGQNGNQNKQIGKNRHNGNQNKQANQNKPNGNQNKPNFNEKKTPVTPKKQAVFLNCGVNLGQQNAEIQSGKQGIHVKESESPRGQSTWVYVSRMKIGTTESEVKIHLQKKFPEYNFTVELLPPYKDAKLPCFKVKVDNQILRDFQNLENWPTAGVKITEVKNNF